MIETKTLLLGGALAGVAAAWSHVKNAARQLSALLVVEMYADQRILAPIACLLNSRFKRLPSGIFNFRSQMMPIVGHQSWQIVPFHVWNSTCVFYRRGQVLVASNSNSGGCHILSLRWMVDYKDFVNEALDVYSEVSSSNKTKKNVSRFTVYRVVGDDRLLAAVNQSTKRLGRESLAESPVVDAVSEGGSLYESLPMELRASFRFEQGQYENMNRAESPFNALSYSPGVLAHVKDAETWLDSGAWFKERGIPWKRGWLIYGPGGTGKSSLAKATARSLGIPIYQYFLSTLTDHEFMDRWRSMETPCVALLEDFDSVFRLRENVTEHKLLTFDCILNTLSGVDSQDGVFLVVTTNHVEHIDPALGTIDGDSSVSTRPGRVDTVIYLGEASETCRRDIAGRVLRDWPELIDPLVERGKGSTPVQFQELCVQEALTILRVSPDRHRSPTRMNTEVRGLL